jgi:hypothetical protein
MPQRPDTSDPTHQNFEYCHSKRSATQQEITGWHADFSLPSHLLTGYECCLQHNCGFRVKFQKMCFPNQHNYSFSHQLLLMHLTYLFLYEETREMQWQLKWAKPKTDVGITAVRVPTDGDYSTNHCKKCNSWQTLDNPTEVQEALQHRN